MTTNERGSFDNTACGGFRCGEAIEHCDTCVPDAAIGVPAISFHLYFWNEQRVATFLGRADDTGSHLRTKIVVGDQLLGHGLQRSLRIVCCVRALSLCLLGP